MTDETKYPTLRNDPMGRAGVKNVMCLNCGLTIWADEECPKCARERAIIDPLERPRE